jgi:hypothetical protein
MQPALSHRGPQGTDAPPRGDRTREVCVEHLIAVCQDRGPTAGRRRFVGWSESDNRKIGSRLPSRDFNRPLKAALRF